MWNGEVGDVTTRREILQIGVATAAATGLGLAPLSRVVAQQRLTENELLKFDAHGNITLLHIADLHGQLMPTFLREPAINAGAIAGMGLPPRMAGGDLLAQFGIPAGSGAAYALTSEDFEALAKDYGRIGGLDRAATVVKAIRAERGEDHVLLFDGGDTWQGSL